MIGLVVLLCCLLVAGGVALVKKAVDGRFRATPRQVVDDRLRLGADDRLRLGADDLGAPLGERATLVQFSSAFCAPCRATRRVLTDVVDVVPGVTTVELDAESHLDLVRRVNVLRTPTVLVLDADGVEVQRASGAPTKQQVVAALGASITN